MIAEVMAVQDIELAEDRVFDADQAAMSANPFDPTRPIMPRPAAAPLRRVRQRERRALILAIIRRLLVEEGYGGITIRRIAELSGHAVQTIYNLVGPRDQAIVEALSEYTLYLARASVPDLDDPQAIVKTIEWQGQSVQAAPDFCRQVCLISFTADRHIFYRFRDQQMKMVAAMLTKQKRRGVFRRDVVCRELAENLTLFSSAVFTEWTDRPYPLDRLHHRLMTGYLQMLMGAIEPRPHR